MRNLAWMLIWVVAILDISLAIYWSEGFCEWELNPVATMMYAFGGITAVVALRLCILALVTLVFYVAYKSKHCRQGLVTILLHVWLWSHVVLFLYIFVGMKWYKTIGGYFS